MRLSEIITIYLAAAAPVGVTYFLRQYTNARRAQMAARALLAALVWPLTLVAGVVKRHARREADRPAPEDSAASFERRVALCQRASIDALHRVEDALSEASVEEHEKLRGVLRAAREHTERYAGLALAARETGADGDEATTRDEATMHERTATHDGAVTRDGAMTRDGAAMRAAELCRVAGRTGDDLEVAARCMQRRNVARLRAHHERARTGLIHVLAELREAYAALRFAEEMDERNAPRARRLSETLLEAFARAVELFSSLDDARSALTVARLLDAECARLRRLEGAACRDAGRASLEGENPCLPESSTSHPSVRPTSNAACSPVTQLP